jgi:hypothetical protein
MRAVSKLVLEDSLPPAALTAYRRAIGETGKVYALDAIAVGEDRCDGLYYLERKVMGINGSTLYLPDDSYPTLQASTFHEYGHGTEAMGYDALRSVGATVQPRWLIEAFNEHLTQAGLFGNFNTVSPFAHRRESTYRAARLLTSALLEAGSVCIPSHALAQEAFRPFDSSNKRSRVRNLIDHSFTRVHSGPESIIDRISRQYNDAPTKTDEGGIMEYWYDAITQQVGYGGPTAAALLYRPSDSLASLKIVASAS